MLTKKMKKKTEKKSETLKKKRKKIKKKQDLLFQITKKIAQTPRSKPAPKQPSYYTTEQVRSLLKSHEQQLKKERLERKANKTEAKLLHRKKKLTQL